MPETPLFRRISKWNKSVSHLQLSQHIFSWALKNPSRESRTFCDIRNKKTFKPKEHLTRQRVVEVEEGHFVKIWWVVLRWEVLCEDL
jgi:hypothetical protein